MFILQTAEQRVEGLKASDCSMHTVCLTNGGCLLLWINSLYLFTSGDDEIFPLWEASALRT